MPARPNPLKLNKLQLRTLVLMQELARLPEVGEEDAAHDVVRITRLPRPHGDHVHIGPFVVSTRDISGFSNPSVWSALQRKGLIAGAYPADLALTRTGVAYETGLSEQFTTLSDH